MHQTRLAISIISLFSSYCAFAGSSGHPAYIRFPSLVGNEVVFTSEGDIWRAPLSGGPAHRLSTHAAEETRPAVSPDGQWLAFTASYEGSLEVYVMPIAGGQPKRISLEGGMRSARSLGWTAQGEVLYSAQAALGPNGMRVITAVNPHTGASRVFPLSDAIDATLDAQGEWLYVVRFGLTATGDTARGYRGGALSQLWRYNLKTGQEAEHIGPLDQNLRAPMLWQNRLIVIADQGGQDNLWSLALDGSDPKPLTQHREFGVRSASLRDGQIAYQLGADLHLLDLRKQQDQTITLNLNSDFEQLRTRWLEQPLKYVQSISLSEDGERVAISARGHTSLAAVGNLRRVDLARPGSARLKGAILSKDKKWVYTISDQTGEQEIWRYAADGSTNSKQMTHDGGFHRHHLYPSPDGQYLAHDDKRGRLWLLDLKTGLNSVIDDGGKLGNEEYARVEWARDSLSLALVRSNSDAQRQQLALYSLADKKLHWLSSDKYETYAPAFSPDGRWLYFMSDRQFNLSNHSPWGDRNTGAAINNRTRIYALSLQDGNRFPFQPKDELSSKEKPAGKPEDKKEEAKDGKPQAGKLPAIQWPGLAERLYEVPQAGGDMEGLAVDGQRLYWLEQGGEAGNNQLKTLAIGNEGAKPDTFASGINHFALSQNGKKILLRKTPENDLYIVEAGAKAPAEMAKSQVRLRDWVITVNPREEWRQMYNDAWRMHRDFLYDAKLRGVDWTAMRSKYTPLAERANDRGELNDVLHQMMGELGALHSQVGSPDLRSGREGATAAGLGGLFEAHKDGFKITHIYRSEAELPSSRPPLSAPGVNVKVGDIITAINGRPTAGLSDIGELLRNQAGQQVLLELRRAGAAPHQTVVTPVPYAKQAELRYKDWEERNRLAVDKASAGRIGYVHLRAMGREDMSQFVREFYGQYTKEGLIIDVRRNNGGNIDSWIIEKLLRRAWAFWAGPTALPASNMQQTFRGKLVVLADELTYSDGETFTAGIKELKLGPVIGKRTAGAGVWLGDRNKLVDGGMARVAENPQFAADGRWIVEGVGVAPDIEVENPPVASFKGQDKQLEAAIGLLQQQLLAQPIPAMKPHTIPALRFN